MAILVYKLRVSLRLQKEWENVIVSTHRLRARLIQNASVAVLNEDVWIVLSHLWRNEGARL